MAGLAAHLTVRRCGPEKTSRPAHPLQHRPGARRPKGVMNSPARPRLAHDRVAPQAAAKLASLHVDVLERVEAAVRSHDVVVVGMSQNPHVRNVRAALTAAGVAFEYLEFGSYLSAWGPRLAIKQWSGWPTFPQVFVRGVLIGGEDLTKAALADGSLKGRLSDAGPVGGVILPA